MFKALGENAYVVISDDHMTAGDLHGTFTGRIFRLGFSPSTGIWNFLPGQDLTATDLGNLGTMKTTFDVLVVGRRLRSGAAVGPVQDVWAYSTYLSTPN